MSRWAALVLIEGISHGQQNLRNSAQPPDLKEDGAAFTRQLLAHEREMRAMVMAMAPGCAEVDDIVQEASVAMWRRFEEYDRERPFVAWALGFTRMQVRAWLERDQRVSARLSDRALEEVADLFVSQSMEQPSGPRAAALEQCLSKLNEKERRMLRLRHQEGYSVRELAEREEFSTSLEGLYKVYARLHQRLIECVKRRLHDES